MMGSVDAPGGSRAGGAAMLGLSEAGRLAGWTIAGAAGAVALLAARTAGLPLGISRDMAHALLLPVATASASVVLALRAIGKRSHPAIRVLAIGLTATALFEIAAVVAHGLAGTALLATNLLSAAMVLTLASFLGAMAVEFFDQIREHRAELLLDIGVVAILAGVAAYLLLRNRAAGSPLLDLSRTALLATSAALLVAGAGVLALWVPTRAHIGRFACSALIGMCAVSQARHIGFSGASSSVTETVAGLAVLAAAGLWVTEARGRDGTPVAMHPRWWVRPAVLGLSFATMAALFVVAIADRDLRLSVPETVIFGLIVLATVGSRAVAAQTATVRASRELRTALRDREAALVSMREAGAGVSASEARLRLLLDSAVDGIVELDAEQRILRVNNAFSAMVGLPAERIMGKTWEEMVAMAGPGRHGLSEVPEAGEATITIAGTASFLEARSSALPTDPPGSLLLIRDVTASRVAEQTIRSLFQFLQDRDEDRTSLLKRTNAAIEAERNRVARDLHDGPIQGISAASLSLEAVRMALDHGMVEKAATLLATVTTELSEEAMNLRRVMKDLRPPLLEQRGLIAAVQEMCHRAQREMDIPVVVTGRVGIAIPNDIETLAYRVVQEALTNVAKHARANRVTVRIEAAAGTLQVEVNDDGQGFDTAEAREFLKQGRVGLASMRERAELSGGTLTIKSMPGEGTSVLAVLPFEILAAVHRAG